VAGGRAAGAWQSNPDAPDDLVAVSVGSRTAALSQAKVEADRPCRTSLFA
jgi:hypothetical protein